MSCKEIKKKSINEIYNGMEFCEKITTCNLENCDECLKIDETAKFENLDELGHLFKFTSESKSFDRALEAAVRARNKWKNLSSLKVANSLHKIWKDLRDISNSLSKSKNDFLNLVSYFDFYADMAVHTAEYKNWGSHGIVLVVLSNYSPFFVLGATVPPALATGCPVIVLVPENIKIVSLFLEEIIARAGLPEELLSTVTDFNQIDFPDTKEINKIFFCGSYLSAVRLYTRNVLKSFNFFCPGNTSALILESGDLDAAVDKLVTETFSKNSLFSVSNIVVQETVYKIFLDKLKYQLQQFFTLNKNSLKSDGNIASEKVNKITLEALNAGADVEKYLYQENVISKAFTVNYQNQDVDEEGAVLKVLLCRTAKEGVLLLNNCRYNLGISIWSEISSQALEVSSKLACPNIWINAHGVYEAGIPLQLLGYSGNCVLGGDDGIFEYLSFGPGIVEGNKSNKDEKPTDKKVNTPQLAFSAQCAFKIWKHTKNRRQYLKEVANSLEEIEELSSLSEMISSFAHFGNLVTSSQRNSQGYLVLNRKIPVGVFLLLMNVTNVDIKSFASLISPIIAFGNAVIVVLKEESTTVKLLIKHFSKVLPKNLLNIIVGIKNGIHLASDPHVQAIWVYNESESSVEFLQTIKNNSAKSLKHVWIIPRSVSVSHRLFQKECLRNQVVWLPNVDEFP